MISPQYCWSDDSDSTAVLEHFEPDDVGIGFYYSPAEDSSVSDVDMDVDTFYTSSSEHSSGSDSQSSGSRVSPFYARSPEHSSGSDADSSITDVDSVYASSPENSSGYSSDSSSAPFEDLFEDPFVDLSHINIKAKPVAQLTGLSEKLLVNAELVTQPIGLFCDGAG